MIGDSYSAPNFSPATKLKRHLVKEENFFPVFGALANIVNTLYISLVISSLGQWARCLCRPQFLKSIVCLEMGLLLHKKILHFDPCN